LGGGEAEIILAKLGLQAADLRAIERDNATRLITRLKA